MTVDDNPLAEPVWRRVDMPDLLDRFDLVEVRDDVILVSDRSTQLAEPATTELGGTGWSQWGNFLREEYNSKLRDKQGLQTYNEMRRSDAQCALALRIIKTPVIAARWYMEPASDSRTDKRIADYVWDNLTKWMSVSWPQLLTETLYFLDFGHYLFEKVFEIVDGRVRWRKFAPRHPLDVFTWHYDANGGPAAVEFYHPDVIEVDLVKIPIQKLLVFTHDKEAGNMQGVSALRPAYKHWYIKDQLYRIDAIQKERHGIGIPVIKLPPNFNPSDKQKAEEMGRNLRSNEKAHIVLPPNWEILMLKLEGQPVDIMESVDHHNSMILNSVLANFMNEDDESAPKQEMFLKGTRFVADIVRDVFNKWAIPELVGYNWGRNAAENPPELRVRRIGETIDWRTISFALRNLVGAGLLVPDEPLMAWIRDELDLPKADPLTAIPVAAPQLPRVGPPRQSTAAGMRQQAQGVGKSNAGRDTSGGA